MTNEEAIIALKRIRKDWQFTYSYDCEAVEIAIRALKNEQTDGDLISRQSVLKCFNVRELKFKNKEDAELMKHYLELSFNNLAKLPSYNSIKTELNGDLISRQSVIGIVEFECGEWKGLSKTIVKAIEQLPSAEKTAESEDKE